MATLYLHGGIHKTGSTALQSSLNLSQDVLSESGVLYVESGREKGSHELLADSLGNVDPEGAVRGIWDTVIGELDRSDATLAVISSESFDRLHEPQIAKLGKFLGELGDRWQAYIVLYVRPQATLLASQYSQQVRVGYRRESYEEFVSARLKQAPRWARFRELLEPWIAVFGKNRVIVRVAEPEFLEGGAIQDDFCSVIGMRHIADELKGSQRRNVSLSRGALEGIRDVLHTDEIWRLPFAQRRALLIDFFKERLETACLSKSVEPLLERVFGRAGPGVSVLRECRERFAHDNKWIGVNFFSGRNVLDECYARALAAGSDQSLQEEWDADVRERVRGWLSTYLLDVGYESVARELGDL